MINGLTQFQIFLFFFLIGSAPGFIISVNACFKLLAGVWKYNKGSWWYITMVLIWPALLLYLMVSI